MATAKSTLPTSQQPPERAESVVAQLDRLPTPSPMAAKLLALSASDESSLREISDLIESDASLSAGILRMVRRADLGVRTDHLTIHRAVVLLGLETVRSAVIAQQFYSVFRTQLAFQELKETWNRLWVHNLATACIAQHLAHQRTGHIDPGQSFLAGLLHDLGKIALLTCFPKAYLRVIRRIEQEATEITEVEAQVCALDHTAAGARLASRWRLPQVIVDTVLLHHQPDSCLPENPNIQYIRLVRTANFLASRFGWGATRPYLPHDADSEAAATSLSESETLAMLEIVGKRCRQLCELLQIDSPVDPYEQIEQLGRIAQRLGEENRSLRDRLKASEHGQATLDALTDLLNDFSVTDSMLDVCRLAARAMQKELGATGVAAFFLRNETATGFIAGDGQTQGECISAENLRTHLENLQAASVCIPAPPWAIEWYRRTLHQPAGMLTLMADRTELGIAGFIVAGVNLSASENQPKGALLRKGFQWMTSCVLERDRRQHAVEELLRVSRRLESGQRDQLRATSLSMIAEMAAGAAHEVNNPLSVISGRAQMLLQQTTDEPSRKSLETIQEQARRASQIISDLMAFAKPEPPRPEPIPLAGFLSDLRQRWETQQAQPSRTISISIGDSNLAVFADPRHLAEVFDALLSNAIQAARGNLRVEINCRAMPSDETVRITVIDNGVGMSPEVLSHALDPFYSYRPAGRGRGLGLSRAYRLVELGGGQLWIESQLHRGTTVTLQLPAAPRPA